MTTYKDVCSAWPTPTPIPTPKEAIAGVKRLVRVAHRHAKEEGIHFGLAKYRYKITSGNRQTWVHNWVWHVNPNERRGAGGWAEIVHSVSHWAIRKYWPKENPHGPRHVFIEKMLADYAIKHFLGGKLIRPTKEKLPVDVKMVRAARVAKRIKVWEAKKRRAENAIRKLRKQERYYDRRLSGNPGVSSARAGSDASHKLEPETLAS